MWCVPQTVSSGSKKVLPQVKLTAVVGDAADSVDEEELNDLILQEYEK